MVGKMTHVVAEGSLVIIMTVLHLLLLPLVVISDDTIPIPPNKAQLNNWFQQNVRPHWARKDTLDPVLVEAERGTRTITVRKGGGGDFKTVTDAVNSIPAGNTNRVIVWIGGGNYTEKITIDRNKPFVTFYGAPNDVPTLVFGGTAAVYTTPNSATLIVESSYFNAVNLVIANSAPRPDGKRKLPQAAALRISGDKAAFYNTKFLGFQDTICDDRGRHFFKDCYIEGTVDFIFGNGTSLHLNTELHVIPGDPIALMTAQGRESKAVDTGYSFVHCTVTGTGGIAYLGRAWRPFARVVYAYTDMSDVVHPQGWSDNFHPQYDKYLFYGEYKCTGPGSSPRGRVGYTKQLSDADAVPFLRLGFVEGSKWLLPPPTL